tara:strand:+ start:117 stop:881 length:765 start_codon:yes stop_codon:yes gene_type:complete
MRAFFKTYFLPSLLSILPFFVVADGHKPKMSALEVISFTLNQKKDIADVIEWSSGVDTFVSEELDTGYMAWIVTPDAVNLDDYPMDFFWLGVADDFKSLGKGRDTYFEKADKLQEKMEKISSLEGRRLFASMPVKPIIDSGPGNGLLTVWSCQFQEGMGFAELAAADQTMMAYMDKVEMPGGMYRWFSGPGAPSSEEADFRNVLLNDTDESRGAFVDMMMAGGFKVAQESYGKVIDCDAPRVWRAIHVVGKSSI